MRPSHIIISPGPCTPREAGVSNEVLKRFAATTPILGVCSATSALATFSAARWCVTRA